MAIAALRGAGKHVICHLENATGTEYYGCAGADAVLTYFAVDAARWLKG